MYMTLVKIGVRERSHFILVDMARAMVLYRHLYLHCFDNVAVHADKHGLGSTASYYWRKL